MFHKEEGGAMRYNWLQIEANNQHIVRSIGDKLM